MSIRIVLTITPQDLEKLFDECYPYFESDKCFMVNGRYALVFEEAEKYWRFYGVDQVGSSLRVNQRSASISIRKPSENESMEGKRQSLEKFYGLLKVCKRTSLPIED